MTVSIPEVKLLTTIPFGQFTASGTKIADLSKVLKRHALDRTVMVVNTLNQPLASLSVFIQDSNAVTTNKQNVGNSTQVLNGTTIVTSKEKPVLGANVDSLYITMGMGATAPTSGDVKIYLVETTY